MEEEIRDIILRGAADIVPKMIQETLRERLDLVFEKNLLEAFSSVYEKISDLNILLNKIPGIKDGRLEIDVTDMVRVRNDIMAATQSSLRFFDKIPHLIYRLEQSSDNLLSRSKNIEKALTSENVLKKLEEVEQYKLEIKYIGNRLNSIEKCLCHIKKEGIKHRVSLSVNSDNNEIKLINENEEKEEIDHDSILLSLLKPKELKYIKYKLGIDSEAKTFQQIGKEEGKSGVAVGVTYRKGIFRIINKGKNHVPHIKNPRLKSAIEKYMRIYT